MSAPPLRVVIADASDEVCHALERLLRHGGDIHVVATAQTESALAEAALVHRPDVLLVDFNLFRAMRPRLQQLLGAVSSPMRLLLLLVHPSDAVSLDAVPFEGVDWMLKDAGGEEFRRRVREIAGRIPAAGPPPDA